MNLEMLNSIISGEYKKSWKHLLESHEHNIPNTAGIYFFRSGTTKKFEYPEQTNKIFYIGQSKTLKSRIKTHATYTEQASNNRQLNLYWSRYEYASRCNAEYLYIECENQKEWESKALEMFAKRHFSFPVANAAGSWKEINEQW